MEWPRGGTPEPSQELNDANTAPQISPEHSEGSGPRLPPLEDRHLGVHSDSSGGSGSGDSEAGFTDLEEGADEDDSGPISATAAAADPAALPRTRIARRAGGFVKRWHATADVYLERYSKRKWADDQAARAGQQDKDGDGAGPSEQLEAVEEPPRKRRALVDAQAFACVILPSGKVKYTTSEGIEQDAFACRSRDVFLSSLQQLVRNQRLEAQHHPMAKRVAGRRLPTGSIAVPAKGKKLPLSKQMRQAARAAFQEHVQPLLNQDGLQLCKATTWLSCKVDPGEESCSAGGGCRQARAALDWWPDNLPLVDPHRASLNMGIHKAMLLLLEERGCSVHIPAQTAAARSVVHDCHHGGSWCLHCVA